MDTMGKIGKILQEGGFSDQAIQDKLQKFEEVKAYPRYDREVMNDWYLLARDAVRDHVRSKGETITEANLRALAVDDAIHAVWVSYQPMEEAEAALKNGEGIVETGESVYDEDGGIIDVQGDYPTISGKNYRWVRIVDNRTNRERILATIYIVSTLRRDHFEMYLARARRGLHPNPFDAFPVVYVQENDCPVEVDARWTLADPHGSQGVKGLRATLRVKTEPRDDHDHLWHFPGFKVRSSKLLPVLTAFRDNGVQRINLSMLQAAIQRAAQ